METGTHSELCQIEDGVYHNLIQRQLTNQQTDTSPMKLREQTEPKRKEEDLVNEDMTIQNVTVDEEPQIQAPTATQTA